ncbi:uncharacterized protein CTRU02_204077 [Colletotrichum truncatum]|uniref:Uncharacterized protein n=1 Tax=Colletotrichum truncatum TaxID=5467 RepID=A0ACC3ZB24_COLTU
MMEALTTFIAGRKAKKTMLHRVATDEVLPVFFFDDTPMLRNAIMCWTMRFNDVLDAEKLHRSLARLVLRDDGWRKLRGRIRLNENDKLEIHVPLSTDEERPAVNFSKVSFEMSLDEHPVASRLPRPSETPSLQANHGDFKVFGISPEAPHTLDDFLNKDVPQLTLHVVSFTDTTLVSLTWPHIACDGVGLRDIVYAWSLVLAGQDDKVPPMLAASTEDPMTAASMDPRFQEKHVLESQHMTGMRMLFWGLRYVLDIIWWPKMETRTVYLPRKAVKQMRADAMASLQAAADQEGKPSGAPSPFISDGDVVAAWLSCMAAQELSPSSTRTVVVMTPIDARSRMPSVFPVSPEEGAYIMNASPILSAILNAQDMVSAEDGVGKTAMAIRNTLKTQTSEGQILALNRLERLSIAENGLPAFFGDTSSFIIIVTNLTKAEFFEKLDFRPAVIREGRAGRSGQPEQHWVDSSGEPAAPGKMVYYHVQGLAGENVFDRNTFFLFGTRAGDYWINGSLPPKIWSKIEESFADMGPRL